MGNIFLKQSFIALAIKYSSDAHLAELLWDEIEKSYSDVARHYHTLTHLNHLSDQLEKVREQTVAWDSLLFALFYHDFVYDTMRNDNEEKSAEIANDRLQMIAYPMDKIDTCCRRILATKGHFTSSDMDTNLFTDADLSILGQSWAEYSVYAKQIRKEYAYYPDHVYQSGRKKVLAHFLGMDRIYKTDYFFDNYEKEARRNLTKELHGL